MARTSQKRESGTCCVGCIGLPFTFLALFVLLLSLQSACVLLWGREVPGRAERLGLDRKAGYELRYSYVVRGQRYQSVSRISEQEASRVRPAMPLRVRVFAPLPDSGAYLIGLGPSPVGATLGLGALCLPLLFVGCLPLLMFFKARRTRDPDSILEQPSAQKS